MNMVIGGIIGVLLSTGAYVIGMYLLGDGDTWRERFRWWKQ